MLDDDMHSVERSRITYWSMRSIALRQTGANEQLDSAFRAWRILSFTVHG